MNLADTTSDVHDLLDSLTGRVVRRATAEEIQLAKAAPQRCIQLDGRWYMLSAPRTPLELDPPRWLVRG